MAWADLGVVSALQGSIEESVQAKYRAFQLTEDGLSRMRVLGDLGVGLLQLKAYASARLAFEIVAASNTSFIVRTNAVLELMDLEAASGNQHGVRAPAGRSRWRCASGCRPAWWRTTSSRRASAWPGSAARSAREELLQAGLQLAEEHRLNAWYFKFERELEALEGLRPAGPPARKSATPAARSTRRSSRKWRSGCGSTRCCELA